MRLRRKDMWTSGVLALAGAVLLAGCQVTVDSWTADSTETWTRSYAVSENARFELENANGAVTLSPSPDSELHVSAEKMSRGISSEAAKAALDGIEIVEQVDPSLVSLSTKLSGGGILSGVSTQVRYVVQVPPSVSVKVETSNGHVELSEVRGDVNVETTNGRIEGRGLHGRVEAHTTNGRIEMDMARVAPGGLALSTTNGRINLRIPSDAKADVSASCVNGRVDTSDLALEKADGSRRHVAGRLNGGGAPIDVRTVNGGIRLASR